MHGDARIEGYHYCMPLETPLALNYHNSFISTWELLVLILMLEICMVTVIVKVHVYCWKYHPMCYSVMNPFAPEPPVTADADPGPFYPL